MMDEDSYFKMSLSKLIDMKYFVGAVLFALFVEYVLIIMEVFENFPNIWASLQFYIVFTLLMFVIYSAGFRVKGKVMINIFFRSTLFIILPIGFLIALYQGYVLEELFSAWLFISDFFYVMVASQYVVMAIMLAGIKDMMIVEVKVKQ